MPKKKKPLKHVVLVYTTISEVRYPVLVAKMPTAGVAFGFAAAKNATLLDLPITEESPALPFPNDREHFVLTNNRLYAQNPDTSWSRVRE